MSSGYEYLQEQREVERGLRRWLKAKRNKAERGRRVLAYIRAGKLKVPRLAQQVVRRALRRRTPDSLHVYVAPCGNGINKLGFTTNPVRRHQKLRNPDFEIGLPRVVGPYSAVWLVQRGNARQIEAWSHAFAHAVARPLRPVYYGQAITEYHRLPAKLLIEIVLAVARWLSFTIVRMP